MVLNITLSPHPCNGRVGWQPAPKTSIANNTSPDFPVWQPVKMNSLRPRDQGLMKAGRASRGPCRRDLAVALAEPAPQRKEPLGMGTTRRRQARQEPRSARAGQRWGRAGHSRRSDWRRNRDSTGGFWADAPLTAQAVEPCHQPGLPTRRVVPVDYALHSRLVQRLDRAHHALLRSLGLPLRYCVLRPLHECACCRAYWPVALRLPGQHAS